MSQAGIVDLESSNPQIPTQFDADIGFAIPIANTLEILGDASLAGSTPVHTEASGNTVTTFVQVSQAIAATDATKIGLSSFDSSDFTVDANGFVSLVAGAATGSFNVDASTAPGTDPVVPTGAGLITVTGAQVASGVVGTNVIRTDSLAANSYTIEIQRSTSVGASSLSLNGVSHFNSSQFSVDGNGFVSIIAGAFAWTDISGAFSPTVGNGYFITGTATATLPAAPSQGDTIQFFVDHASQLLTIQAFGAQIIRFANQVTAAGGTAVSTLRGDSVELVYRSSNTCWEAVDFNGGWNLT